MLAASALPGCKWARGEQAGQALGHFGRTGRGDGEFIYPRAIDVRRAGGRVELVIADKTGRIQWLDPAGTCRLSVALPACADGKPTGLSVGPDGNLYVADTHYHRVLVYDGQGRLVRQFGRFGQGEGEFIYPTDVAFAPDGRIFVSEYGGNDRVSIFDAQGRFLGQIGSPGEGEGQFSRPQSLAVDAARGVLYVADACNHRIARYDLAGRLLGYVGRLGDAPGELRYPYGLALAEDGTLVVCEFGNNRLQLFDPQGRSRGIIGSAGRELGQLAYPWSVAVHDGRAYVLDSGSDRVQVWRL